VSVDPSDALAPPSAQFDGSQNDFVRDLWNSGQSREQSQRLRAPLKIAARQFSEDHWVDVNFAVLQ
jgi:hypothetical protein